MQLPPTILSNDKHGKKPVVTATSKKNAKSSASTANGEKKLQEPTASKPQPEEGVDTSPSDADSDTGSVTGDEIMEQDTAIEVSTEAGSQPKEESKEAQKKVKKRTGLRPPRTLETTLFDRLEKMYGPDIKRLLNIQYR
jgi:DNA polymerase alpha-associated DNA helicase A